MRSDVIKRGFEKAPHRALLRATGILCVYGSGFGVPAERGYFRIVFLASPDHLRNVYRDIGAFTREYLARG